MKKFTIILSILFFLSFNILIIPSFAEPKTFVEGYYDMDNLELTPNTTHNMQNSSPDQYAFAIILDSNQIVRQFMTLKPQSGKYNLVPIEKGYQMVVIGSGNVVIS